MKRAQVTLFIIIGVVALLGAGMLLYYVGLQANKPIPKFDDITPVRTYVTTCINKLSDEALITAGRQSGIIFISQGGKYPDFQNLYEDLFYNKGKKDKKSSEKAQRGKGNNPEGIASPNPDELIIPSSIISPKQGVPPADSFVEPPDYPKKYFPYTDAPASFTKTSYLGYFGINVLRRLEGENDALSVQTQIEAYIENNLQMCTAKFANFPEYEIKEEKVKTTVLFADEDTVINVTYPLEIRKKGTGEVTKAEEFTVRKKVRMKKIYEVANWVINKDITDVTYDIISDSGKFYGMEIEKKAIDDNENVGSFITIRDGESSLEANPYYFTFTRQNRNPALDFIKVSSLRNMPSGCSYDDVNSIVTCSFIEQDELICPDKAPCWCKHTRFIPNNLPILKNTFPTNGNDPDEDQISFRYTTLGGNFPKTYTPFHGSQNTFSDTFRVYVSDGKLDDWQDVRFDVAWVLDCS